MSNFNFYFPCGGGDLKTAKDIFDYFKSRNFTGVVSCRETPDFKCYLSYEDGYYWLTMLDHNNYADTNVKYALGQRMTEKKLNLMVWLMENFIRNNF